MVATVAVALVEMVVNRSAQGVWLWYIARSLLRWLRVVEGLGDSFYNSRPQ